MTNYLIVHGSYGNPDGNWFRWLEKNLQNEKNKIFIPQFPTPEGQNLSAWKEIADRNLGTCTPAETVLIGHSTGAGFVLRLAELTSQPYKTIYSVCPFMRDLDSPQFDPLNETFVRHPIDWGRVKKGAEKIICFAGDNDPYVPLPYSEDVARQAAAELIIVENGGHLNAEFGYLEFPLLLEKIRTKCLLSR